MRRAALIGIICLFAVLMSADGVRAQADSAVAHLSSRVALLPFANLAEAEDIAPRIASQVRAELLRKSAELADSMVVEESLRRHRIRNTAEPDLSECRAVAEECSVRYLMLGSIDRYEQGDSSSEVAFSARVLDVPTGVIVWANSVAMHRDPRGNLLGIGSHAADKLMRTAIRKLFAHFRYDLPPKMKMVQALKARGGTPPELPCRKVMLVTFGNETETHFAGNVVANELLSALLARGFTLVDPGRVRETMLSAKDLMQGEISSEVLAQSGTELGADFVLTGTVSRFESVRGQILDDPTVAFEARLIDVKTGEVVWAKTYTRNGKDSGWIFDIGSVHGLTVLSERMTQRLANDLPVIRARMTAIPNLAQEDTP